MISYKSACNQSKEYAADNNIEYQRISVKEYDNMWLFSYVPNGRNYTFTPKISIKKEDGEIENFIMPVPPLSNLDFYRKGKDIEFLEE